MSGKRILVVKGSPREKGNSSLLADQLVEGAKVSGADVEVFILQNMNIQACNACDACQESPENGCILEDDMQTLYPKLRQAEAIVIATPVYWFTMSAQTKLFIDRWYALESTQGNALKGKTFGIILTYGDTDPVTSGAINAIRSFEDMFRYLKADLAGFVYGSANQAGEIRNQKDLLERAYKLGQKLAC
ncbi:MAG: flavodoxin family protein [Anaerolineaceae bacterium]|jgi:multimeric flavodoxin WrbA